MFWLPSTALERFGHGGDEAYRRAKACRERHALLGDDKGRSSRLEMRTRASVISLDRFRLAQARQQAVELAAHEPVTFAGAGFEAFAIEHTDMAAAVMDQAFVVQLAGRFGNAFAAHAEHVGDQ